MSKTSSTPRALIWAVILTFAAVYLLSRGRQDFTPIIQYNDTWAEEARVSVLIDVADHLDAEERAQLLASLPEGAVLNSDYSEAEGLYRLELTREAAMALDARLEGDARVEFVEPEYQYETFGSPNDPYYQFQWNLDQVDIENAWRRSSGVGVVVAVIDTGVAYGSDDGGNYRRVEDLSRFVPGYDFVDDDEYPFDEHGHGTHVAGTVAQTTNNNYGVASVAPGVKIMPLRVLNEWGYGHTADIADAIRYAADHGADVINMSLGGMFPSEIMADAINYAYAHGVVVVAAAGNSGWSLPSYPAANEHVIAVAATQYDRSTTFYSNYGDYVDIAAPGGNTQVDQNDDGQPDGVMQETISEGNPLEHEFALYMGTSMASPHVAGAAALVMSMGVTHPDRVEEILLSSASEDVERFDEARYGAGLLDAGAASSFPLVHYQLPRALLAVLLVMLVASSRRFPSPLRDLDKKAAYGAAVVGASGIALASLPLSWLGFTLGVFSPLSTSILHWPSAVGLDFVSTNALWLSVLPALGLYALLGGTRRAVVGGLVVGLMVGISATLLAEAMAPLCDVAWVPGAGGLDRLWLGANGAASLGVSAIAARKE